MLSTIADSPAEAHSSPSVVSPNLPSAAPAVAWEICPMTPVSTRAPTMTNPSSRKNQEDEGVAALTSAWAEDMCQLRGVAVKMRAS